MDAYIIDLDETDCICFLMKDKKFLEKYNGIWENLSNIWKNNSELIYNKKLYITKNQHKAMLSMYLYMSDIAWFTFL